MKRLISLSFVVISLAAIVISGCKPTQKTVSPVGEKEVVVMCSGPDFFTTDKVFRANSQGESMDYTVATKMAMTNARASLAASIQTTVKTVTDNYTNSRSMNRKEDLEQKFESLNREVVDQTLSGIRTICEKHTQLGDGTQKCYVAIELSADDLVKKYNERMATDDKLKIDYDYQKFKDTFDQEMKKMADEKKAGN